MSQRANQARDQSRKSWPRGIPRLWPTHFPASLRSVSPPVQGTHSDRWLAEPVGNPPREIMLGGVIPGDLRFRDGTRANGASSLRSALPCRNLAGVRPYGRPDPACLRLVGSHLLHFIHTYTFNANSEPKNDTFKVRKQTHTDTQCFKL